MTRSRFMTVAVLMFLAAGRASAQVPADLQKAIDERAQAVAKKDAAAWDRLTTDDFTVVNSAGVYMTKAQRLAELKTQKPGPVTAPKEVHMQHYGDTYLRRSLDAEGDWSIDVWVRQPTGWRVAAVQLTTAKK